MFIFSIAFLKSKSKRYYIQLNLNKTMQLTPLNLNNYVIKLGGEETGKVNINLCFLLKFLIILCSMNVCWHNKLKHR